MTDNPPRRHHTVAKNYLAGFADARGQISMRRRSAGRPHTVSISDATVQKDFYAFVDNTGARNVEIETWMATEVEGPAAEVLRATRESGYFNPADALPIARFVALSLFRTATVRSFMQQADPHIRPLLAASDFSRDIGLNLAELTPQRQAQLRQFLGEFTTPAPTTPASLHRTMLREIDAYQQRLAAWGWRAERTPASAAAFITADAPVTALPPKPTAGYRGIIPPGATIFLPLSPHVLLIGKGPDSELHYGRIEQLIPKVNRALATNCHDSVFCHPDLAWPKGTSVASARPKLAPPRITVTAAQGPPDPDQSKFPGIRDQSIVRIMDSLRDL